MKMTKGIFQLGLNIAYNTFKVGLVLCSMAVIFDCRKADLKSMFLFHECSYFTSVPIPVPIFYTAMLSRYDQGAFYLKADL